MTTNPNDRAGAPRARPRAWAVVLALSLLTAGVGTIGVFGCEYALRLQGNNVKSLRGATLDVVEQTLRPCTDVVGVGAAVEGAIVLDEALGPG